MLAKKFLDKLARAVGLDYVLTAGESLSPYASDSKITGLPPIVAALPRDTKEVCKILKLCHDERLPVVTRGAGTGMAGGAVPERLSLVLDLSRMNRVGAIDVVSMTVEAEAGVVTEDLQKAVERAGLFYPPDPASADRCTIGGNAATNAGGLRAVKYGVTGQYVLGMTTVLADGRIFRTGVRTRKGVVGYDLTHLIVGSEGTLAVICELTLRLIRNPEARRTMIASFSDIASCGKGVEAILASDVLPAAIELVDEESVRAVEKTGAGAFPFKAPFLLIEADGREEIVSREIALLDALLRRVGAKNRVAVNEEESKSLWDRRRAVSEALKAASPSKMAEDVAVPISRLVELLEGVRHLAAKRSLTHVSYGHAGDGNLHVNILYDPALPGVEKKVAAFRGDLFDLVLRLGGTISGEHGIGISKRPFIHRELSPVSLELHRAVKFAFDPLNILNPGKIWMEKG